MQRARGMRRRKARRVFEIKARLIVDGTAAQVFAALQEQVAAADATAAEAAAAAAMQVQQVQSCLHMQTGPCLLDNSSTSSSKIQ